MHAKVGPLIMSDEALQFVQPAENNWEENYAISGSGSRHGREFWYARRAFLKSYQFSEQNGNFKDKAKRWAKEVYEVATGVLSDIRRQISKRRLGSRAYRFTLALPSRLALLTATFFTPLLNKKACLLP